MKQHLEIEFKTMLTEKEYLHLTQVLEFGLSYRQINSYFDTPSKKLFSLKTMMRIRKYDDSYEFTLKIPQDLGVMEHEFDLETFNINHPKIQRLLSDFDIKTDHLEMIAQSTTDRREFSDQYGTWCLDFNSFSWGIDHELEYELHDDVDVDKAYHHYYETLSRLNITFKKALPKYIRALN
ncbi:CYTH domain-containing protein [Erysipelothrix urinaevulpis]|uniref:CYTH domain-containing protein n=1 Tax=Erysipelothrix urinaevulpis TaxID=2683717 RepID=UPI00135B9C48|nr:CYTH domain-containing protein [Erysipelothrix urinaevulpis]